MRTAQLLDTVATMPLENHDTEEIDSVLTCATEVELRRLESPACTMSVKGHNIALQGTFHGDVKIVIGD